MIAMANEYRKKPVVIEAVQYEGDIQPISDFMGKELKFNADNTPYIKTLEGVMIISLNDYVIKGVQGEFYPCKPDIFEQTYDKV